MKSVEFIKVRGMPEISSLLSMYISQIQTVGLLGSFYVGDVKPSRRKQFVNRVSRHVLKHYYAIFGLAETYLGTKFSLDSTPILYNPSQWSLSETLGGYATTKLRVKASELTVSYVDCWNQGASILIKGTVWYVRSKRNFVKGFDYLLDLFDSGFIINQDELVTVGLTLLELYAKSDKPLEVISTIPLEKDSSTINELIKIIDKVTAKEDPKQHKIQDVYVCIMNRLLNEISTARKASSLGEFMLSCAKINGQFHLLNRITNYYKLGLKLSLADQAFLSQTAEMHADFAVERISLHRSPRHFPIAYLPYGINSSNIQWAISVAREYAQEYKEGAIDKLFEDRLLIPYPLKEIFKDFFDKFQYNDTFNFNLPNEWNQYPLLFALPLAIIKRVKLPFMRSKLLSVDEVSREFIQLYGKSKIGVDEIRQILLDEDSEEVLSVNGISREFIQLNGKSKISVDEIRQILRNKYSDEELRGVSLFDEPLEKTFKSVLDKIRPTNKGTKTFFYEIYVDICMKELKTKLPRRVRESDQFSEKNKLSDRSVQLKALSTLYPWNATIFHEMCIVLNYLNDKNDALENIQAALLLEPNKAPFWRSFMMICLKNGSYEDARFAEIMEGYLSDMAHIKVN